ncbi:FeoB-associated Cys-rich membrane protein [Clostridium aminobutyricum]|uniref:FeoB-associated Cys-rich membrane protein n=1 Tax=Clostridium aminobutyricum TaxID=33953 RepID=A0A939D8Y1_CLOAM|nr:FeoB-associated Cys-rich membrane protein [Clostridium aminobutyricum]MBN7773402.1 FeoB-associated Cys-rich membrane protein [Clostridium aminobutyricum]
MITWLTANAATIVISIILVGLILLAIRSVYRSTKQGGCVGCSHCSDSENNESGSDCHCHDHPIIDKKSDQK